MTKIIDTINEENRVKTGNGFADDIIDVKIGKYQRSRGFSTSTS